MKTTFIFLGGRPDCGDEWQLVEDQVHLAKEKKYDFKVPRMAVIIHPKYDDGASTALLAVDPDFDIDEDLSCFYCGDDDVGAPCKGCGLSLCTHCDTTAGCTCKLAEGSYVAIDGFVPDPGQSKRTTFSKAQRKKVMRGHDAVTKQDRAMWATLTGKPILSTAKKSCWPSHRSERHLRVRLASPPHS